MTQRMIPDPSRVLGHQAPAIPLGGRGDFPEAPLRGKPWFKFYPETWLSDAFVRSLPGRVAALYWDMIATCAAEGGLTLPDGWPTEWGRLPDGYRKVWGRDGDGNETRTWRRWYGQLTAHFIQGSDHKWWNKRLLREWGENGAAPQRRGELEESTSQQQQEGESSLLKPGEEPAKVTKAEVDALVGGVVQPMAEAQRVEVIRRPRGGVVDRLCSAPWDLSPWRAQELQSEYGLVEADLEAWSKWEVQNGTRLMKHLMPRYGRPSAIPEARPGVVKPYLSPAEPPQNGAGRLVVADKPLTEIELAAQEALRREACARWHTIRGSKGVDSTSQTG